MIEVRRAAGPTELQAALDLREEVFCVEQGVTVAGDRDGRDDEAVQLVAVNGDGEVVGTCRLLLEDGTAKFGRFAVRRDHRGAGVGRRLLALAEREALARGARRMGLAAQTRAMGIYERAGFTAYGETFDDEGIPHRGMEKSLA